MRRRHIASVCAILALTVGCAGSGGSGDGNSPSSNNDELPRDEPIPGMIAADVKANLERTWNLKFTGPQVGAEGTRGAEGTSVDLGRAMDPDTGATLTATLRGDPLPLNVTMVQCSVQGGTDPKAVAQGYLGYCATIPYESAQPQAAKAWTAGAVGTVQTAAPVERTFPPVAYMVAGDARRFWFVRLMHA